MFWLRDKVDVLHDVMVTSLSTECRADPSEKFAMRDLAGADAGTEEAGNRTSAGSDVIDTGWQYEAPSITSASAAHHSTWQYVGLAAVGFAESCVSIILLLSCVYRRSKACCAKAESPAVSSTDCVGESCPYAEIQSAALEMRLEQLVAENKALRTVVNAAWLGNNIDILDFEKRKQMQSDDSSEVLSDGSTCDDMASSPFSFSISDSTNVSDDDEDLTDSSAQQMERHRRPTGTNIWDIRSEETSSEDMQDDSSSIDLRDEDEEQEELIRRMEWQMATGKWQNEDENLIRVMCTRW